MSAIFARIEAYSQEQVTGILGEASRDLQYCSHVPSPRKPIILIGSFENVRNSVTEFMNSPAPYKHKNGTTKSRKRRKDWRCMCAGVLSWHQSTKDILRNKDRSYWYESRDWANDAQIWLERQFGKSLTLVMLHLDEGYPHIHFFCCGDANRIHPGLSAEFENGERIKDGKRKFNAHRLGLKEFLDDYFENVGKKYGLFRRLEVPPRKRIKDRNTALRVLELERHADTDKDPELRNLLDETIAIASKASATRMRF